MSLRHTSSLAKAQLLVCGLWLALTPGWAAGLGVSENAALHRANANQASQSLVFESNQGQYAEAARFVARGAAYYLTLSPTELRVTLQRRVAAVVTDAQQTRDEVGNRANMQLEYRALGIELVGANRAARMTGNGGCGTRANYFLGNDPAQWQVNVPAYQQVRVTEVYPGIDLLHYGNQQELEYDFEVAPGADPAGIAMRFTGADQLRVDPASGDLLLTLGEYVLRQPKPVIYQTIHGERKNIAGSYFLATPTTVKFSIGDYDPMLPLMIDPVVSYSKLFGGAGDDTFWAMAVDGGGNVYLAGETLSPGLTTAGAFQTNLAGSYLGHGDVIVAKFNNQLSATNYITYLGGLAAEAAFALAVDGAGNAYITGYTDSTNFPTRFPVQPNIAGAIQSPVPLNDVFVAKLDPAGSNLLFSTFYGGSGTDVGIGIALDASNNIYVVGQTDSTNFPTANTTYTARSGVADGFVLKLASTGSSVDYSMYLGGTGSEYARDVVVNVAGNPLVTGYTSSTNFPITTNALQLYLNQNTNITSLDDSFFVELSPAAGVVNYGTFLGGTNVDHAIRIATDASGAAYIAGWTQSGDYPRTSTNFYTTVVSNSAYADVFVTKLNPGYTNLGYSVTFGGSLREIAWDIAVDTQGRAAVIGETASADYPTNGLATILRGANSGGVDAFIAQLNAAGTAFIYSAYLGGIGEDVGYGVAVDAVGNAYYAGRTASSDFPLQPSVPNLLFADRQGFVVKILPDELAPLNLTLQGTDIVLSWSAAAPEFQVQSSTNLALANAWMDLNVTPVVTNSIITVTLPLIDPAQFFRLRP